MAFVTLTHFLSAFRTSLAKVEQSDGFAVSELKVEVPAILSQKGLEVLLEVPNPEAGITPDPAYLARLTMSFSALPPGAELTGPGGAPVDPWKALYSGTTESLYGIHARSSGDVHAVGKLGVLLWSPDGETFGPASDATGERLHALWGSGAGELCAVGANGLILRCPKPGGAWAPVASTTNVSLNGITGTGSGLMYAVGDAGTLLQSISSGTAWQPLPGPSKTHPLHAVWSSSNGRAHIVGGAGTIVSKTGDHFQPTASGTSRDLFGVWGSGPNDVYVVGAGGKILHSTDGLQWTAQPSGTTENLYAVWGSGPGDVYAVGRGGTILHTSDGGTTWKLQKSGTTEALHAISGTGPGEVWIAGAAGTLLRRTSAAA
ncbi:WD40/YVTN/BNR-like repeat-containing protein [Polyangium mundeleinium]|uniref:DUF6242 domain-containing protein n=1 Tax=Polyangium mundeleinium TaxID=2995306 RepID=A0ABT5F5B9_9BACT|nr:hypothetical protein [Polyangium mundeleinium]MDC0749280.1 hypothetical protein [Polyangium mundeleinium]